MELIVATGNQNKLEEIRRILGDDSNSILKSLNDLNYIGEEPEETEPEFEGNALLKARYYQSNLNLSLTDYLAILKRMKIILCWLLDILIQTAHEHIIKNYQISDHYQLKII